MLISYYVKFYVRCIISICCVFGVLELQLGFHSHHLVKWLQVPEYIGLVDDCTAYKQ